MCLCYSFGPGKQTGVKVIGKHPFPSLNLATKGWVGWVSLNMDMELNYIRKVPYSGAHYHKGKSATLSKASF